MTVRDKERFVVIGGGQAAAQMIEVARQEGFAGSITLISNESLPPYQRPPLSKQYLTGSHVEDWLLYRPRSFYPRHDVELHLGRRAMAIDRARREVLLDDGALIGYDRLAIATGTRALSLDVPGADLPGIHSIRTAEDVAGLRERLQGAARVVIVGGGFIGLEAAAALVQTGRAVTLLARQDRLISRVVPEQVSRFLTDRHLLRGVAVKVHSVVAEIRQAGDGAGLIVHCTDGTSYPADVVIVGIGAVPNVELAAAGGLGCADGILVDEYARCIDDESVLAAGDCTNHPNPLLGRRIRLETVHNAVEQGRTAGLTVAGRMEPYAQSPWVWSDQYEIRLQSVGIIDGDDLRVQRGSAAAGRFAVFHFREGALLGVTTINQPKIFGAVRRILNTGGLLTPEQAADPDFDLDTVAPRTPSLTFDIPWDVRRGGVPMAAWGHD